MSVKGNYDTNADYEKLDVVYFQGSSYIATDNVTGEYPDESEKFQLLARGYNAGSIVEVVHVDEATLSTSTTMGVMYLTTINYTTAMVFCVNTETRYTQYGYTVGACYTRYAPATAGHISGAWSAWKMQFSVS